MGVLLLKPSLEFKMPQSCWHNTASCGHVSAQQAVGIPLFSWDPGVRQKVNTVGARQEREGAQEGEGDAMRGHISAGFSVHFVPPQFTSCAGEKG